MSGGSKIFIGNIPYGVTDEVIVDILGRAGQVLNFRAMTDKDTGKPKGYGFAEFSDSDAAYSAVRNLNDFELQGRKLRVDYANEKDAKDPTNTSNHQHPVPQTNVQPDTQTQVNRLPTLPPGQDLQPGVSVQDAISKTLNTLPVSQLLDILVQMQQLVATDPVQAQQLLDRSPQLSYAIFQALLNMNLVDPMTLSNVIQPSITSSVAPPPPMPAPALAPQLYQPPAPPLQPIIPTAYPPPPQYAQYSAQPYQPAPVPAPQPPVQQSQDVMHRAALIQQVLSMSQEQIDALGPNERQQIIALRQQLQSGAFR